VIAALVWLRLDFRLRWRSLAVLAILVALASGTVFTAVAGARRGGSALDRLSAVSLPATATVLANQPGFDWAKVRALPEVEAISRFPVSGYAIDGIDGVDFAAASFPPVDADAADTIERGVYLAGRPSDQSKVDEAVATPGFLSHQHKRVGDTLIAHLATPEQIEQIAASGSDIPLDGPVQQLRIVGVVRSPWYSDQPGGTGGIVVTAAFTARYWANLVGNGRVVPVNALVRLRGGPAELPEFKQDLARVSGRTDIDVWDNAQKFGQSARRVTDFERSALLAFAFAVFAAALFLIGQSVARYAAAAVADLQVLRALGLTPRQAVVIGVAGTTVAGVLGGLLGAVAAVFASAKFPIGSGRFFEPHPGISADWVVLGPGLVVVPLLVLLGSAAAAWAALAGSRSGARVRRSAVAAAVSRLGLPVPVVVGARFALEPGRGRSAVPVRPALAGAVVGVLGVLAALTFQAGVSDVVSHPERFGQTYQLGAFSGENSQEPPGVQAVLRGFAADPDVTAIDDSRVAVVSIGTESVTAYAYAAVGTEPLPTVVESGRMPQRPNEIALAPTSLRHLDARVGDTVDAVGAHGRSGRLTIVGKVFVPTGPHNDYDTGGWLSADGYDSLFGAGYFKFHMMFVALRPGADPATVAARLNQLAAGPTGEPVLTVGPPDPLSAVQQVTSVRQLPFLLGGFLALLAVGAVGHALATAVRRRRHDVAVLRVLGFTRRHARLTVVTQATVLAAAGLLFGVPLGVALGRTVWRVVADNTPVFYVPPLAVLALALIGPAALLVANLLAAVPGQRAARMLISHVLRAE
jgi:hypothetical protein